MKNLANRIRPTTLSEIIGQTHLLKPHGVLNQMIENNYMFSTIFYGPPGTGKSTIAQCLVNDLKIPSMVFNASIDNKEKSTLISLFNGLNKLTYGDINICGNIIQSKKNLNNICLNH